MAISYTTIKIKRINNNLYDGRILYKYKRSTLSRDSTVKIFEVVTGENLLGRAK